MLPVLGNSQWEKLGGFKTNQWRREIEFREIKKRKRKRKIEHKFVRLILRWMPWPWLLLGSFCSSMKNVRTPGMSPVCPTGEILFLGGSCSRIHMKGVWILHPPSPSLKHGWCLPPCDAMINDSLKNCVWNSQLGSIPDCRSKKWQLPTPPQIVITFILLSCLLQKQAMFISKYQRQYGF